MALFKVYYGDKINLPSWFNNGYGYVVVQEAAEAGTWTAINPATEESELKNYGVGEWYIDTPDKRYRLAAAKLIDENGNLYTIDDCITKSFNLTILQSNWSQTVPGYYTNTVALNPSSETLHCGVNNEVPPLIYHGSTAIKLYNLLDAVRVSNDRKSLTFFIKASDYESINADIPVIVIDHR